MDIDSLLLPCPTRYFLGMDCPGCGFQRSLLLAFRGEWAASFALYPPWPWVVIQLLVLGAYILTGFRWKQKWLIGYFIFTGILVYLNYIYKLFNDF